MALNIKGRIQKIQKEGPENCWRACNIAPYPKQISCILGLIEQYHSKNGYLQKFFKKSEHKRGVGRRPRPSAPFKS